MHAGASRNTIETIDVVVVDDDAGARDWTSSQLARCTDIRVIGTAADGAEAYRLLDEVSPACVVLDMRLPDCSGVDIARYLRRTQTRVAVVALTGDPDPTYRSALARLGVRHVLSKTISGADLEVAIRDAVTATRARPVQGALRILIVEDHPLTGHGTSVALEQAGLHVVALATSGAMALELASRHQPDLVVLDLQLPDVSGVMVAQQLLRHVPRPKIVILTAQRDEVYSKALFRMGINGYLTKETSPRELVAAIEAVARGDVARGSTSTDDAQTAAAELSQRERDILTLVAQGRTNTEIADSLHVSTKTVEYHLTGMFQRFDVRNRTELTHYAAASGLL